jgi:hypothetical protein
MKGRLAMPHINRAQVPVAVDSEVLEGRYAELGEITVSFERFHVDADGTPMFRGLPDDRCQCPHWGVVVSGEIVVRYAGHDETYRAGDAYFTEAGHVPVVTAGTEVVEFSPTVELQKTMAVLAANMQAAAAQP